jgi:hypothetical protein
MLPRAVANGRDSDLKTSGKTLPRKTRMIPDRILQMTTALDQFSFSFEGTFALRPSGVALHAASASARVNAP